MEVIALKLVTGEDILGELESKEESEIDKMSREEFERI